MLRARRNSSGSAPPCLGNRGVRSTSCPSSVRISTSVQFTSSAFASPPSPPIFRVRRKSTLASPSTSANSTHEHISIATICSSSSERPSPSGHRSSQAIAHLPFHPARTKICAGLPPAAGMAIRSTSSATLWCSLLVPSIEPELCARTTTSRSVRQPPKVMAASRNPRTATTSSPGCGATSAVQATRTLDLPWPGIDGGSILRIGGRSG